MHGYDRDALSMMALAAREAMAAGQIEAVADKGYFKSEEILACEQAGISVVVPKPQTSNARARCHFDKADFAYDAKADVYICPAWGRSGSGVATTSKFGSNEMKRCGRAGGKMARSTP